jgi:hypothetical protein
LRQAIGNAGVDPLLATIDLPFRRNYYPAGFPLELATNSREVVAAAEECWRGLEKEFAREPLEIRVITRPQGRLSPEPSFRCQGYLYSVVGDADNFAVADFRKLFAFVFVSEKTAADHAWLRWFFLESLAYTLLAQRHVIPVHAACVARNARGILLCGPSGAGKSTLSFACARAGWNFVSDDCTWLLPDSPGREAIGRPREARFRTDASNFFPELGRFAERARPNGKISLVVPMGEFPRIETASRCSISCLAFLDRGSGVSAPMNRLSTDEACDLLLRDRPLYGLEEVDALHERTLRSLAELPAYRLRYGRPEDGCELVTRLGHEHAG